MAQRTTALCGVPMTAVTGSVDLKTALRMHLPAVSEQGLRFGMRGTIKHRDGRKAIFASENQPELGVGGAVSTPHCGFNPRGVRCSIFTVASKVGMQHARLVAVHF